MRILPLMPALFGAFAFANLAQAQEPRFLEWNVKMTTPTLQSGMPVLLKNIWRQHHVLGCTTEAPIDIMHAGINLLWKEKPQAGVTDVRFEIANPGMMTPGKGPITFAHKVAIKVGAGGKWGGYLKCKDTRFGIDMNFDAHPAYEWRVINMAPLSEGITGNHKLALLNVTKKAFLVYQSRKIGFELGWWTYKPPLPPQVNTTQPSSPYYGYRSNHAELMAFVTQLQKINPSEARFLRSFFGIK